MAYIPRAFAQQEQLDRAISGLKPALGPEVVRLRYSLGQDWTGDSAIFFRIVLTDRASRRDQLLSVTTRVEDAINRSIQPELEWGVLPYYRFRSESETTAMPDDAWA